MFAAIILSLTVGVTACSPGGSGNDKASTEKAAAAVNPNEPGWKSSKEPITFDWYMNFSWFGAKWGEDLTSQYITDKTGVSVNFIVPPGNENEKLNTLIASGDLPDFITIDVSNDAVQKMIEGKLVLPLNELADQYDPYFYKTADPAKLAWMKKEDGNVYGFPNASSSSEDFKKYGENFTSAQTFLVRKDMYEAIGSPDMRTPEGFLGALQAAKEKFPEVNGQPLIPLGLQEFTDIGNNALGDHLMNFLALPREQDGEIYDRTRDPEYIKWLKTFAEANRQGLLSKDIFIDKRPQMEEKIAQGRYFAMMYQRTDMSAQNASLYQQDPNSVYIAVDGPSNTNMDQPTLSGPGIGGWTLTMISKNVKDKARAVQFLTYLISEEGQKDTSLGQKGITYDTIDGKDQLLPEVIDLMNKDGGAAGKKYGVSYQYWMLMDTNMRMQWDAPSVEPGKQLEDWTKGKTVDFSLYEGINPTGTSEEGIVSNKINQEWGRVLPKLLFTKSDAEFDDMFNKYLQFRESAGYNKIIAYQNAKLQKNKEKLVTLQ
ncbi:ABC transporter substrate-binding protein [Saccharibacillus kuerlensis]|uniref:ABC transporter substrate-binding protein n=2 Tax=Saccharibacillus kuerlensis TaxID=459527 RepID=A0ABQ2L3E6_9BACL|nr:ABC transporter substrate-binding protein [Saccharibacillus kuerlensis]